MCHRQSSIIIVVVLACLVLISLLPQLSTRKLTAQESPDNDISIMVYARRDYGTAESNTDVYSMFQDGSNQTNLTNHPAEDQFPIVNSIRNQIVFLSDRSGSYQLYIMDVDGSNIAALTQNAQLYMAPIAWSPEGDSVVFTSSHEGNAELYAVDADTKELIRLTESVGYDIEPSWSADGNHLAFIRDGDLYMMDSNGSNVTVLFEGSAKDPIWSHDGTKIAFAAYVFNSNSAWSHSEVFVVDLKSNDVTQLTENEHNNASPSWSPDDEYLAFVSNVGEVGTDLNSFEIFVVPYDGSESPTPITADVANDTCPTWSDDELSIFFLSDRRVPFESNEIYSVHISSGSLTQLTRTDGNELCPLSGFYSDL